jgi:glycine cleavage system regulatory protein
MPAIPKITPRIFGNPDVASNVESLLSEREAASVLRISLKTLQEHARNAEIEYVQVTKRKRAYTLKQIQQFIERKTIRVPVPVTIDRTSRNQVPSPRKGGDQSKSSRESVRAQLREEMRSW